MLLAGAFTVLILVVSGVSTGIVLPPTNLTVSCHNLDVTARWEYSRQQPQTRFRVHIRGAAGEYQNETTYHHFNLSHFVWKSEERYREVHVVTVTAVLGGEQSKPVQSNTFTFSDSRPAELKCKLPFPPVDLKVDDSEASVTFRNPLHFYRQLQQAEKLDSVSFEFDVTTADGKSVTHTCPVDQENCQREVLFPEDGEKCVTLRGWLYNINVGRNVAFNETGPICPDTSADVLVIVFVVLLSSVALIITVITICICLTKSWTIKKNEPIPPMSLRPVLVHREKYCTVPEEDFSVVRLVENPPPRSPSVSSDDDDLQGGGDGSNVKHPDGCYADGGLLENSHQELEAGYSREDDDSANDSVKTECVTIDLEEEEDQQEEEERSPYDCPHNLQFDEDDGNMGTS
uniref:interferon gamma receptor 1 n=1 Tax=Semicossyphus pulcher TaxID=241346 RepID=UPI0037E92AD8